MKHSYKIGLHKRKTGKEHWSSKTILQYDLENNFIKEWESQSTAASQLNIWNTSISSCCNGKTKTAGGYIWKYKDAQ